MADITTTWGLDHTGFNRGARDVERDAARAAARAERDWKKTQKTFKESADALLGVGAAGAAVAFAKESMDAYAKSVGEADGRATGLSLAVDRLKVGVGRDLTYAFDQNEGSLTSLIDEGVKFKDTLVDLQADWLRFLGVLAQGKPGDFTWSSEIDRARDQVDAAKRTAWAQRERSERAGGLAIADRQARGGPGADAAISRLEEEDRHRRALMEAGARKEKELRDAAIEDENKLHAIKERGLARDAADRRYDEETTRTLAELEVQRYKVAQLRADKEEEAAIRLEKSLDAQKMQVQIERDRSLTGEQKADRVQRIDRSLIGREIQAQEARKKAIEASATANAKIADELEQARIMRMRVDGHQTEAELAEIRLGFEQKIRDAMKDQALSAAEQARAAKDLARSRDSVLKAAATELLDKARSDYSQALASRSFRTVEAGMGYRSAGVLGPAGATESVYMRGGGQTAVAKTEQLWQRAVKAMEEINRKTPARPVGAMG